MKGSLSIQKPPDDLTRSFIGLCVCGSCWLYILAWIHRTPGSQHCILLSSSSSNIHSLVDISILDVAAKETRNKQDIAGKSN